MLRRKDGHNFASSQVSQRVTSPGMLSSSRKGTRNSHLFQAVPNSLGYLEPLEDSTWSQNVDSAASMYPPPTLPLTLDLDLWGEDYQDLSSWCSRPQQDTLADTKGSSCIVQDDELNTPEVGVQHEFNFTASCNVLKENTWQYLSDGWETSPQLQSPPSYVLQKSSIEPVKGTDTDNDNTRSITGNEFFTDDGCVISVSHEEEIVTSHNVEGPNVEDSVQTKESNRLKQSVNLYELGVAHVVKSTNKAKDKSVGQDNIVIIKTDTDRITDTKMESHLSNTDKAMSLQSLLGSDFCVGTSGKDSTVEGSLLLVEENLSLKSLLSGSGYTNNNAEVKILDETYGSDTVMSKVTDTVLPKMCEIIRPVLSNTCMSQTLGSDDAGKFSSLDVRQNAAKFAGQKEMTPSMFKMELSVKLDQQSGPVGSEPPETGRRVEILEDVNSEPHVAGGGNAGSQPQAALQEENATGRNLELNVSTAWEGTDESSITISTPDVMEFLLKQNGSFDLVSYLFSNPKEVQQDLLPVSGDDRISLGCTGDVAKVAQIEQSSHAELFDNTQDDAAVKVEVVQPFSTSESDHEWKDSVLEPMELEAEMDCSLKHRSDRLLKGQKKPQVKKALRGSKHQQIQKVAETIRDIQPGNTLESTVLQDGSELRIKISKVKVSECQTSSTNVALPEEQVSAKLNGSELKDLSSPKQTRGRPTKRALPSTSEEKNERHSANRPPQRKSKYIDEPWIPPSKRRRLSSDESCNRYRELRDKNNEASRKSRQNRKARESEMQEYAAQLESENQSLKIKADEMERLVKKLRESLLEAVVKTKK